MKYKVEFDTDTEQYFELGVNWYSPMRVKERKFKIVKIFNSEGHYFLMGKDEDYYWIQTDYFEFTESSRIFRFKSFDVERFELVLRKELGMFYNRDKCKMIKDDYGNVISYEYLLTGYSDKIDWDKIKNYLNNEQDTNS